MVMNYNLPMEIFSLKKLFSMNITRDLNKNNFSVGFIILLK